MTAYVRFHISLRYFRHLRSWDHAGFLSRGAIRPASHPPRVMRGTGVAAVCVPPAPLGPITVRGRAPLISRTTQRKLRWEVDVPMDRVHPRRVIPRTPCREILIG